MHHIKPVVNKKGGKRAGKGFSIKELEKAGLTPAEAKKLKIPVDKRRETVHDQNVKAVKVYAEKRKAEAKPKKPQKKKAKK